MVEVVEEVNVWTRKVTSECYEALIYSFESNKNRKIPIMECQRYCMVGHKMNNMHRRGEHHSCIHI